MSAPAAAAAAPPAGSRAPEHVKECVSCHTHKKEDAFSEAEWAKDTMRVCRMCREWETGLSQLGWRILEQPTELVKASKPCPACAGAGCGRTLSTANTECQLCCSSGRVQVCLTCKGAGRLNIEDPIAVSGGGGASGAAAAAAPVSAVCVSCAGVGAKSPTTNMLAGEEVKRFRPKPSKEWEAILTDVKEKHDKDAQLTAAVRSTGWPADLTTKSEWSWREFLALRAPQEDSPGTITWRFQLSGPDFITWVLHPDGSCVKTDVYKRWRDPDVYDNSFSVGIWHATEAGIVVAEASFMETNEVDNSGSKSWSVTKEPSASAKHIKCYRFEDHIRQLVQHKRGVQRYVSPVPQLKDEFKDTPLGHVLQLLGVPSTEKGEEARKKILDVLSK